MQPVIVDGEHVRFTDGESIWTDSYKYAEPDLDARVQAGDFTGRRAWTDARRRFAVLLLDVVAPACEPCTARDRSRGMRAAFPTVHFGARGRSRG
jgi:hypothetical protein